MQPSSVKLQRAFWALALLAAMVGCESGNAKTVPDDLLGVWKTSEPKYADRFFELRKDTIIFGTGGDNADIYSLDGVETTHDEEGLLYHIYYLNVEGQRYTFSVYYDAHHGVIRFKNQKHFTWKKEAS